MNEVHGEWQVVIDDNPSMGHRRLFIFRDVGPDEVGILYYDPVKDDFTEKVMKPYGPDVKPTFVFPRRMRIEEKLVQALAGKGIRPDSESKNEGMLRATERHLSDLRQLLKLKGDLK